LAGAVVWVLVGVSFDEEGGCDSFGTTSGAVVSVRFVDEDLVDDVATAGLDGRDEVAGSTDSEKEGDFDPTVDRGREDDDGRGGTAKEKDGLGESGSVMDWRLGDDGSDVGEVGLPGVAAVMSVTISNGVRSGCGCFFFLPLLLLLLLRAAASIFFSRFRSVVVGVMGVCEDAVEEEISSSSLLFLLMWPVVMAHAEGVLSQTLLALLLLLDL
jgi:hypothetical protein